MTEVTWTLTGTAMMPEHEHSHAHDDQYAPLGHAHVLPPPITVLAPTHLTVAASNSLYRENATLICDGVHDEEEINLAIAGLASGGKIELLDGTFTLGDSIQLNRPYVTLIGQGCTTQVRHSAEFPADGYLLSVYNDAIRPMERVTLRDFEITGTASSNIIHGLRWCGHIGLIDHVNVNRMTGNGINIQNVPGSDGTGWNSYETMWTNVNIVGCNVGLSGHSADQHFSNLIVRSCVEANVKAAITGGMIVNSHFYSGTANHPKTQTLDNVILHTSSRTRFANCKLEHAARRLLWLHGDPKGGFLTFDACGFRNGSGAASSMYPQVLIDRAGGSFWRLLMSNCVFDVDYVRADGTLNAPTWNIQIQPGALRNSRISGCAFDNALNDVTPFAADVGMLSARDGLGWNSTDPNLGGDWNGRGEYGLRVLAADSKRIWTALGAQEWI